MGKIAIGIDLGTTYSCVGAWMNGMVEIIPNEQGNRITPSCVSFDEADLRIGEGAKNSSFSNPSNTIFDAKRFIGRRFTDSTVQRDISLWPFKVVADTTEDKPMIPVKYKGEEKLFSPEHISAMLLSKMKENSEKFLGCEVHNAVVSVPAYFNGSQRRSTRDAATNAGLNVLRIINEPSAAALAYAQKMHNLNVVTSKKTVLVFDLGGGTFDVSLVEIEDGTVVVKATAGDTHLGGQDFDNRMVEKLFDAFKRKHGMDESREARARCRLKLACERAKRNLSFCHEEQVHLDCFYKETDLFTKFTRAHFEELNMDLFHKCISILDGFLRDAKVDKRTIDDIVLVGGSTRIPKVREMVRNFFQGKELSHGIHEDEVVAYGAAIQAAMLVQEPSLVPKLVLKDVTPLSLGVMISYGMMHVVIPRNSPIPKEGSVDMQSTEDNQTGFSYDIYEGERSMATDNNLIGGFTLEGICPKPAYTSELRLVFNVDEDGILDVSATDLDSGKKAEMAIKDVTRNDEAINKMLADAERYKLEDDRQRRIGEAKSKLRRFAYTTRNASKPKKCGMHAIEQKCVETIQWLEENASTTNEHECEEKKKELDKLCEKVQVELHI